MRRVERAVPAAASAAGAAADVVGSREHDAIVLEIEVGLRRSGAAVDRSRDGRLGCPTRLGGLTERPRWLRHGLSQVVKRTMIAAPVKMKSPPTITAGCNCPWNTSVEKTATNSG